MNFVDRFTFTKVMVKRQVSCLCSDSTV